MYNKTSGEEIKTLVLSGGGTSVFSMYLGMFKDIDLDALTFDLVLCSAGALWFCEVLCRKLQTDRNTRIQEINEFHNMILEVDLVSSLESENETILSADDIERLRRIYSCIKNVRIKDLKNLCNGRLIRFSVSEIKEFSYEPIIVDETNSADTLLFDVILASCSLPLIFPTVSLPIDGEAKQCLDGSISDYPSLLVDDSYTVVQPRTYGVMGLYDIFKTKIPLIDNLLKLLASVVMRGLQKSWRGHHVFHDCAPNIHAPMWDEELFRLGEKAFEANFTF